LGEGGFGGDERVQFYTVVFVLGGHCLGRRGLWLVDEVVEPVMMSIVDQLIWRWEFLFRSA
jgi:hypothetical protein